MSRTQEAPDPADLGRARCRYLLAVYRAGGDAEPVPTGELRRRLSVSAASVTGMCTDLDEAGLLDHEKYRGVELTPTGEAVAERVARRFCAVSTFFESELGSELDDGTSYDIGFALPAEAVPRLRELAGERCLEECPAAERTCCAL